MLISIDAGQLDAAALAEAARLEAGRHPPRTPERRAAAHLWVSLITSPTIDAARRTLTTFGAPGTQTAALELLGRIITGRTTAP